MDVQGYNRLKLRFCGTNNSLKFRKVFKIMTLFLARVLKDNLVIKQGLLKSVSVVISDLIRDLDAHPD